MIIKTYIDSGANAHSCRKDEHTLDSLGVSEEEWANMSQDEKENFMRPIIWDTLEWGFHEEES